MRVGVRPCGRAGDKNVSVHGSLAQTVQYAESSKHLVQQNPGLHKIELQAMLRRGLDKYQYHVKMFKGYVIL